MWREGTAKVNVDLTLPEHVDAPRLLMMLEVSNCPLRGCDRAETPSILEVELVPTPYERRYHHQVRMDSK